MKNIKIKQFSEKIKSNKFFLPMVILGVLSLLCLSELIVSIRNLMLGIFAFAFLLVCIFLSFEKSFYALTFLFCIRGLGGEFFTLMWFNLLCCEAILVYGIKYFVDVLRKKQKIYWVPLSLSVVILGFTFINFNLQRYAQIFDFILLLCMGYLLFVNFGKIKILDVCKCFFVGIVISSFVGLFFWTIPSTKYIVIYGENRFCGLTDNPNHLEIMNVIALSMLIYLVIKNKIGWVKAGFYFVCFEVFGLLTQSKTFLICQIILLIIVLICMIKRNKRTGLIFSAIFLILIILICIIFSEKILKIIERFTQDYGYTNWLDVVTTGRWSLFKAYFNDFINSGVVTILFGKGLTSPITFKNTIHNLYLYLLYYLGIVGICLVMAILISYLFIVKEKKKRFELINFLPMFMLLVLGVAERIFFTSTFIIFIPFIFLFDNENKQDKTSEDLIMQKLKYLKFKDFVSMIGLLLVFIPAIITKLFIRDFWLVCEDENEARDNGYWFFKYISENHPKQKVAYAINKKSPDYNKVKGLGKIISYGTLSHWFWYLVADKNISSQKGGKPNAAVCYLFEVVFKLRKNNRIFLQHGVTINDAKFIYYNQTYMRMLTTSTFQEFDYINERFGYPKDYVKLLGMPRFDNLNNNNLKSDQILVMPTWRNWISREVECEKYEGTKIFTETGYYKTWNEFLNSKELDKWLTKNKKKIVFYPHRNMQKYIHLFNTTSENITIADVNNYDVQTLLNESSVLITDYSSVFFDFAYLEKPIIFYQFDEEKFRKGQYAEGYFDYHNNDLGFWTNTIKGVLENLNKINLQGTLCNGKKYFKYIDNKNCERNYLAIKNLKNNKLKDGKKRKND